MNWTQILLKFWIFNDMRHISYNNKLKIRKLCNYELIINDIKAT